MIKALTNLARKALGREGSVSMQDMNGKPVLLGGGLSDADEVVTEASSMALSAVWACTNLIAGTISTLPVSPYRNDGTSKERLGDHPLRAILQESPNYDQTPVDFIEFIGHSIELWGNAYARVIRSDAGRVVALVPVAPQLMSVRRLQNGSIEYTWTDEGKRYRETDQTMLHIRGPGGHPLGGWSTLHYARNAFGLARASDRAAGKMFANGMRPSVAISFETFLTTEQREIAETIMVDRHLGAMNSGRPVLLEGNGKLEPITINPDDAQMLESRKFSVEEICRFFGVPPHMVGHTSGQTSWGSGLEQQTLGFQKFTLRRRIRRIEQAMNKQLLTPAERAQNIFIEFNLEGLLRADSGARASYYREMSQIGAMTINEIRALENLPPVAGGDVPRVQMQNQPITQTAETEETTP